MSPSSTRARPLAGLGPGHYACFLLCLLTLWSEPRLWTAGLSAHGHPYPASPTRPWS